MPPDERGFFRAMAGDGRPLLALVGVALALSGLFALFLAGTGQFLPHDERFLGMTAEQLCGLHGCRVVHFMIHDRIAFGGALVAVGVVYLWLAEFPLRRGEAWAWWLFLLTGAVGFGSFFAYLGYGYLDAWHGVATLALLPCFVAGLALSRATLRGPRGVRALLTPAGPFPPGPGRGALLATALGMTAGGLTILAVGMSCVFVPQDLRFLGLSAGELHALNPRLVPLIAHDRAGFGGAVTCCGLSLFVCAWCARPARDFWQMLALAGLAGFATAIGAHPAVGYVDAVHLAPAVLGAGLYAIGLAAFAPACLGPRTRAGSRTGRGPLPCRPVAAGGRRAVRAASPP
jgi:hypothetical protein